MLAILVQCEKIINPNNSTDQPVASLVLEPSPANGFRKRLQKACLDTAHKLGLEFKWKIAIAPGVGHSNANMAPFAEKVLFK